MPRLRQIPLAEIEDQPRIKQVYQALFNGNCPVSAPGTESGSPGHWWSTLAHRPYVFNHAVDHLSIYGLFTDKTLSELDPQIREIAMTRTGYAVNSRFVFSQHCKAMRNVGISEEKVAAIPHWQVVDCWTALERAVLAYTDAVVLEHGRVPDGVFDVLKAHLSEGDIVELTYHIGGYILHGTFCRALKLEFDDVEERISEVPAPAGKDLKAWAAANGVDKK